jgi:pimeloyl-ACP methyl ester carboxylesterase
MNSEIDVRPILPSIRVPTLIMHRTGDGRVQVEAGRYLARHIPTRNMLNCRARIICSGAETRIVWPTRSRSS